MSDEELVVDVDLKPELKAIQGRYRVKPGAEASPWKEQELFSPEDAVVVWENVKQALNITPETDITFLSPTSNAPTHEFAILQHEAPIHTGNIEIITSDVVEDLYPKSLLEEAAQYTNDHIHFSFSDQTPAGYPHMPDGAIDVLWDRKGYLWHTTDPKKALEEFDRLLAPGGALVIDADYGTDEGGGSILDSTNMRLEAMGENNPLNSAEVKAKFDTFMVGEGKYRVRILRKKGGSENPAV